jgi:hypothetical protein
MRLWFVATDHASMDKSMFVAHDGDGRLKTEIEVKKEGLQIKLKMKAQWQHNNVF